MFRKGIIYFCIAFFAACGHPNKRIVAKLDHTFSGCFGGEINQLTIYEEEGVTFARLEKNRNLVLVTRLMPEEIKAFQTFTNELARLKEKDGCTTVEDYLLSMDGKSIHKTDGGCDWHGFNKLQKKIFGSGE